MNDVEGVGGQLPSLDIFNDFRGLLPLAEVDLVRPNHVGILVDERQLREEDACMTDEHLTIHSEIYKLLTDERNAWSHDGRQFVTIITKVFVGVRHRLAL